MDNTSSLTVMSKVICEVYYDYGFTGFNLLRQSLIYAETLGLTTDSFDIKYSSWNKIFT